MQVRFMSSTTRLKPACANGWQLHPKVLPSERAPLWPLSPVCVFLQWFAKLNLLLPALSATARVEPVDGDGFCVVYSMLASQGCDIDEETIEDCLGRAQHNCQQFLAKSGMDVVSFYS